MSLAEVFNMGFSFLFEYYQSEAWNENKLRQENEITIRDAFLKGMSSVIKLLGRL